MRLSQRGSGAPIILIHGWKMSHRAWDKAVVGLARRFRVISYDLRGMGESDKPDTAYDFVEYARDLADIVDSLDLHDATIVGWSMGCSVVLNYLSQRARRLGRAVLMNGPVKLLTSPDFPYGLEAGYLDDLLSRLAIAWPEQEREFIRQTFHRPHPECVEWFTRIALQTPLEVILRTVMHQRDLDFRQVVASAEIPLLAIYGRHDPYYPAELAQWIARTARYGQCMIFEDSAHCPPIEETDRFVEAIAAFISAR